jgi:GcrA cell cycle regulator
MLWTEEAVESLKRLALEGMSASVIAVALGAESRNAVIGKANRIGIKLSGGGRASTPGRNATVHRAPSRVARLRDPATALNAAALRQLEPEARPAWAFADAEVGEMRRLRFEDIRELACRWPIGDPRGGDFVYCGLTPVEGRSYCAGHCRMAYRPPNDRAGRSPQERRQTRPIANSWRAA